VRLQREEGSMGSADGLTKPGGLGGLWSKSAVADEVRALATTGGTALLWLGTIREQPQSIAPPAGERQMASTES
jgi:hypothetical protein